MRDRFPLVMIGGLLLLGFLGGFVVQGARRGSFADLLSTYRSEPDGTRALYLLAQESGLEVERYQRDLAAAIDPGSSLVLLGVELDDRSDAVQAGPLFFAPDGGVDAEEVDAEESRRRGANVLYAPGVSADEREGLLAHVRAGHTLIYAPWRAHDNPLLDELQVELLPAEKRLGIRTLVPSLASPWTLGVERVEAHVAAFLDVPSNAVPLLEDPLLGETVAALLPYGQGRIILIGAPELATNAALARADNAQLWLSLLREAAGEGQVAFDEYHHGFTSDRSVAAFARRYGLHFAAAQLLLGLMLWAASLRRFGRPRAPDEEQRVGSTDALFAASRLYREGRHRQFAAAQIVRGLIWELAPLAGLAPRSAGPDVAGALAARGRPELGRRLTELFALQAAVASDAGVQQIARAAALLRAQIRRGRATAKVESAPAPTPATARKAS